MSRIRKFVAVAAGVLALSATAAPIAQAQPLPGGSVELPPVQPIAVPVPGGSSANQLPALPYPLFWQEPAPRFVASNWVEPYSGCPAAHQRAYAEDGTQLWCTSLDHTDARLWAPYTTRVPWPGPATRPGAPGFTEVANSLGAKPCDEVDAKAIDPSNGQEAYCAWQMVGPIRLIWQYQPGS